MTADREVVALFKVKLDTVNVERGQAMIRNLTKSLKVLAGGAGLGFAIRGLRNFAYETARTFDELSKGARTVSFSRKSYQEWQATIELAGGTARSFSKYVFFMQRGIGEAVNGLKTYSDAFKNIGLNPRELQKMLPEDQFEAVFNGLAKLEDQTQRNAAAQRILGRGGRDLTVAMQEQLGMHVKNRKEMQRLNAIISDQILIRSEKFIDRTLWLTKALRGLKARALDALLDVAEPFISALTELAARMSKLADKTYMFEAALLVIKGLMVLVGGWILLAVWPTLLWIAALVALFLIFESVYSAMQGSKSMVADWYKELTGKDLVGTINEWKAAWDSLFTYLDVDGSDILNAFVALIKLVSVSVIEAISLFMSLVSKVASFAGKLNIFPVIGEVEDWFGETEGANFSQTMVPMSGGMSGGSSSSNSTNNQSITINMSSSGDPQMDARNVAKRIMSEQLDLQSSSWSTDAPFSGGE